MDCYPLFPKLRGVTFRCNTKTALVALSTFQRLQEKSPNVSVIKIITSIAVFYSSRVTSVTIGDRISSNKKTTSVSTRHFPKRKRIVKRLVWVASELQKPKKI
jgi:hypothetical protein